MMVVAAGRWAWDHRRSLALGVATAAAATGLAISAMRRRRARRDAAFPPLANLALIGDRRTAAVIGSDATIWWYCPRRFDDDAFLVGLLDVAKGGWRIELAGATPAARSYLGQSAVLETRLAAGDQPFIVTDWLTMGDAEDEAGLLCRTLSRAPRDATISLTAWHNYGREPAAPVLADGVAVFATGMRLFASHPLRVCANTVRWTLPAGEDGWTVLADGPRETPRRADLARWRAATLDRWHQLAARNRYDGPYKAEIEASLRQLRLLIYQPTGAVVAAATVGLPEVIGGRRDYDYRYSWLRDTAIVVRALLRTVEPGHEGEAFLGFVAKARRRTAHRPLDAAMAVDGAPVPSESNPPLSGYRHSFPVRIGNQAGEQLQLGAFGSVLLAAASVYRVNRAQPHWDVVQEIADFLMAHWHERDSGAWENPQRRHYTASKVFAACGLEAIAPWADAARAKRYRDGAQDIRRFVMQRCLRRDNAFASFAGGRGVDVTAALFPVWSFCPPDSPQMVASIQAHERDYRRGGLFKRDDRTPQSRDEGAFLPATFWMAQYWANRGDAERARFYIEAGLRHANDVGLFAEEVCWNTGRVLGNLPLGMTHASFINAVVDLKECEERLRRPPREARGAPVPEAAVSQSTDPR